MNGDGYQDWLLWAWPLSHPANYFFPIYFGGPQADTLADAYVPITSHSAVYAMGDFSGDGFSDLYTYDEDLDIGRMYFGGGSMDTLPDWTVRQPPPGINQTIPYAMGDFDGDGASDFLCFNPNSGNTVVFLGGAATDTLPAYFWTIPNRAPIGGVRSLNGDNTSEFLFKGTDVVDVFFGRDSLLPVSDSQLDFSCTYADQAVGAGDFNHDGFSDLILFSRNCSDNMFGSLTLHLGHPWIYPGSTFTIDGTWPDGLIGIYTAAGLGDVNGDSIDDIAIGAWDDFAYLGWRGRCIIIAGNDSLIAGADDARPELPISLSLEAYPNPFNSVTTIRLRSPVSHGLTTLIVYDVLGREVKREVLPPFTSSYTYHLNADDLPSGVYLAHIQSGQMQATQKLMLLK
ncbi:T9SS type A sorting domain-containing protein [candidate division KSB1 bacterium]|nr:T9SS type A sorting domain-containing protein [candidate division KSB1 bacterium]